MIVGHIILSLMWPMLIIKKEKKNELIWLKLFFFLIIIMPDINYISFVFHRENTPMYI